MRWLVAASTVNFSTEICLRFNLGPLLAGLIEDVIKQHGKVPSREGSLTGNLLCVQENYGRIEGENLKRIEKRGGVLL